MIRLSTGAAFGVAVAAAVATPLASASAAQQAATPSADTRPAVAAEQAQADHQRQAMGLSGDEKLIVRDVVIDADGTRHVRYDRTYKGLRVLGGDFVARKDAAGQTRRVYWNGSGAVAVTSTSPRVAETSAEQSAARRAGYTPRGNDGELVVWAGQGTPRLAWDVVTTGVRADQTPSRLHTVVDADSGAVISSYDEVETGTGNSMYSGSVTLNTISSGSSWLLKDAVGNYTTDLNGATSGTGTAVHATPTTCGGTGRRATARLPAWTPQYGAEKTFAYYKNVQGRNGIWNNGTGARSRVHYGNAYDNAFWDGTQMTYGDGASNAKPLTSIDVAGPRDEPRRHREHRRAELLRGCGRPERGDLRHLRHLGRVLREQRARTSATTSSARRSTSTATAPRCATWTSPARTAAPRTAGRPAQQGSTRTTPRAR